MLGGRWEEVLLCFRLRLGLCLIIAMVFVSGAELHVFFIDIHDSNFKF